eukprot:CAMPEP_0119307630 /NCGR_PEP_ID=MMETSP1333-20130426/8076_1 /TAXON_ID=418940 /ORGANISM="Scyphosphaera apsteinii, Strain RCC1455" /LENGTH=100 /DNA_ID=CAMNT_0007311219 /DNA_START=89 /DNA_END=391 /DNA_ORIENTATION=+
MMKDLQASEKEIARQEKRIQEYKEDSERDDSDVKKQEEVLAEFVTGRHDELDRLRTYRDELITFIEQLKAGEAWESISCSEEAAASTEVLLKAAELLPSQ